MVSAIKKAQSSNKRPYNDRIYVTIAHKSMHSTFFLWAKRFFFFKFFFYFFYHHHRLAKIIYKKKRREKSAEEGNFAASVAVAATCYNEGLTVAAGELAAVAEELPAATSRGAY